MVLTHNTNVRIDGIELIEFTLNINVEIFLRIDPKSTKEVTDWARSRTSARFLNTTLDYETATSITGRSSTSDGFGAVCCFLFFCLFFFL